MGAQIQKLCEQKGAALAKQALADLDDDSDNEEEPGSTPVTDAAGGKMNGIDIQKCLDAHNELRAKHGAPPLEWDDGCSQHALAQAQICCDNEGLEHGNSQEFGEGQNLYCYFSTPPAVAGAKAACESWYSEIDDYDFNDPGFGMSTGHFTQLVWKGSTKVGMAKVVGESDGMTAIWIAANYSPAGNMQGDFEDNVEPAE
eukprot:gnl/MRDRNA2_/MRDRNA2_94205_c0_seq1.p1 gnl/MRDRNA2_/MRDRNA2_94205_c0~~gnl/MRDRNA2_/MRDRNA2_94205_c0_seq1.p1  ORF type:complete len:200 (+),score=52.60 gnl/MRDRNA2_/MRDRNA2_94205_c0_seq1:100-699(+)